MYYKIQCNTVILILKTENTSLKGLQLILVFSLLFKVQIGTNQLNAESSHFYYD